MKPVDLRNETWESLQERLEGDRRAVYEGLMRFGARTTRALAAEMERDPFSVRPRVCELVQCGFAALVGREGREGVYAAVPLDQVQNWLRKEHDRAPYLGSQDLMEIGV